MVKPKHNESSLSISRLNELIAFDRQVLSLHFSGLGFGTYDIDQGIRPRSGRAGIAGFDEAGRGALAGPAVVACVHLPFFPHKELSSSRLPSDLNGVDDSKRLTAKKRETLFERITCTCNWGVGVTQPREIDTVGIVAALQRACRRAYANMRKPASLLLFDRGLSTGTSEKESPSQSTLAAEKIPSKIENNSQLELQFTRGDSRSLHIAAASIVAKVVRDRIMVSLDRLHPGYGLARNKGYGTAAHMKALHAHGPSPIHRLSFRIKTAQESSSQKPPVID